MVEVVWSIIRKQNRLLMIQRSPDGMWTFPGGKIDLNDPNPLAAAKRELIEETGITGHKFRKLFSMPSKQLSLMVLCCNNWSGTPQPSRQDVMGIAWLTIEDIHIMGPCIDPFVIYNMPYLAYIIQNYDQYPDTWLEPWVEV